MTFPTQRHIVMQIIRKSKKYRQKIGDKIQRKQLKYDPIAMPQHYLCPICHLSDISSIHQYIRDDRRSSQYECFGNSRHQIFTLTARGIGNRPLHFGQFINK
eukprot:188757_1